MADKLHALLAVEDNYKNQAGKTMAELGKTFESRRHIFGEKLITTTSLVDASDKMTEEQGKMTSKVVDELNWIKPIIAKSINASHLVDVANTLAKADIVTEDGKTIHTGVPATSLLRLEHTIEALKQLITRVPTLDPTLGFERDTQKGTHLYKAREIVREKTKKTFVPLVLAAATDKHPAQVKEGWEDKPVGKILQQEWSSLITPDTKAKMLDRLDILDRAVRKARARANEQEVALDKADKLGEDVLKYVLEPLSNVVE